jgi:hypothetical protein
MPAPAISIQAGVVFELKAISAAAVGGASLAGAPPRLSRRSAANQDFAFSLNELPRAH